MTKGHFLVAFGSVGRPVMEMGKVGGWLRAALGSQGIASVKASRNFALGGRGLLLEQEPAESAAILPATADALSTLPTTR
jgi:hypothetical protein